MIRIRVREAIGSARTPRINFTLGYRDVSMPLAREAKGICPGWLFTSGYKLPKTARLVSR